MFQIKKTLVRPAMAGTDRWADRWGLSRCDNPAIASGATTRSASGTTIQFPFAYLACFAVLILSLITAPAVEPAKDILLWPNGAPGSEGKTNLETVVRIADNGEHVLSNIHKPSITPYLPLAGQASGCAVIVAPGGGHRELWSDHEGHNVARWLSEHGIAAFVLKYRLAKETNSTYTVDDHAVADMQRALRLVRSRAAEWGIATNRIGVMGFSAGGEVAFLSAQRFDAGKAVAADVSPLQSKPGESQSRVTSAATIDSIDGLPALPAFQALIYPGRSQRIEPATNSPPVFLVCGSNDRADISEGLASVYLKFKQLKVPTELHIYAGSGHGFGFRPPSTINSPPSTGTSKWLERFEEWLADRGFLKKL
jgi:acetyl esterase/lipase